MKHSLQAVLLAITLVSGAPTWALDVVDDVAELDAGDGSELSTEQVAGESIELTQEGDELTYTVKEDDEPREVVSFDDPWEPMNRGIYKFNRIVDRYTLNPIAKAYTWIMPDPFQRGVHNFFENLEEVRNIIAAGLQLKGEAMMVSTGRFLLNSTFGILGLFDVASHRGLTQQQNDFGMVFATWGLPSGPYVMLPLLGPATLRSAVGKIPDSYSDPVGYSEPWELRLGLDAVDLIDVRVGLMEMEELVMGDEYSFVRDTFLQHRVFLITGETPEDDF